MATQSNWIVVEAEIEAVQNALASTSKSFSSIQKQSLGIIARNAVAKIRQEIKSGIKDKIHSTGELQKSYGFRVKKDGSEANIYPRGLSGSKIFPKAFIQNYGHSGPTSKADNWEVKPKGFIEKTENAIENNSFESDLQKMVDKIFSKYWD